jgi:predicted GNAT family acetyltransferase
VYRLEPGRITVLHTWVPEAIGGRGIAGELVKAAFDWARAEDLKVRPACSYSDAWMRKHPEYEPLRA